MTTCTQPELERRPVQQQIADYYAALIEAGRIGPGQRLPSRLEIVSTWQVTETTAYRAIAILRRRGLVISRRGDGTYATPQPARKDNPS